MPATLVGWLLFAVILFSAMATAASIVEMTFLLRGRGSRGEFSIPAVYAFGSVLVIATAIFLAVEPARP